MWQGAEQGDAEQQRDDARADHRHAMILHARIPPCRHDRVPVGKAAAGDRLNAERDQLGRAIGEGGADDEGEGEADGSRQAHLPSRPLVTPPVPATKTATTGRRSRMPSA